MPCLKVIDSQLLSTKDVHFHVRYHFQQKPHLINLYKHILLTVFILNFQNKQIYYLKMSKITSDILYLLLKKNKFNVPSVFKEVLSNTDQKKKVTDHLTSNYVVHKKYPYLWNIEATLVSPILNQNLFLWKTYHQWRLQFYGWKCWLIFCETSIEW